jgi:hypothetical protein
MLSGGRKTGTLPDKNNRAIRAKRVGDYIADRDPSLADHDQRRDPPAFGAQRRHDSNQDRWRVHLYCACRQAVGDDECDVITATVCVLRKRRLGT